MVSSWQPAVEPVVELTTGALALPSSARRVNVGADEETPKDVSSRAYYALAPHGDGGPDLTDSS